MKVLIFKIKASVKYDDRERLKYDILSDLRQFGITVVDDSIDVYEVDIDEGAEEK